MPIGQASLTNGPRDGPKGRENYGMGNVRVVHMVSNGTFGPEPTSRPDHCDGVAVKVVRDCDGGPLACFDGNGLVIWTRHGVSHEVLCVPWRGEYSAAALDRAVNAGGGA